MFKRKQKKQQKPQAEDQTPKAEERPKLGESFLEKKINEFHQVGGTAALGLSIGISAAGTAIAYASMGPLYIVGGLLGAGLVTYVVGNSVLETGFQGLKSVTRGLDQILRGYLWNRIIKSPYKERGIIGRIFGRVTDTLIEPFRLFYTILPYKHIEGNIFKKIAHGFKQNFIKSDNIEIKPLKKLIAVGSLAQGGLYLIDNTLNYGAQLGTKIISSGKNLVQAITPSTNYIPTYSYVR